MHTPPLNHNIPSARNRLLQLAVRPLAVDDVERRRRREHSQLAVEDDHVVRRGRAVLQSLPVSSKFLPLECRVRKEQG